MNKLLRSLTLSILILAAASSQAQDYMDKIAQQSCECVEKLPDTLDPERYTLELGLCMIEAASHYQKQLKKDHKIDFSRIDEQGEQLGMLIGMRMASICPSAFISMAEMTIDETEEAPVEDAFLGTVVAIEDEQFVVFAVKDERGKIAKFFWLTFIETESVLSVDYASMVGKMVMITFITQEFFDPRIGEYRMFNIITRLDLLGE